MHGPSLLYFALFTASAFAAQPMIHDDFEQNDGGWTAFGPESAHVHVTREPGKAKNGKSALELDYEASATKPAAAILPVQQSLGNMKSVRFWMMAESAAAAACTLSEKQGGRYVAVFWLEPNVWQRVELTPDDFVLADGPSDPRDPDGKLDLDQIEAIGLVDISQILNATVAKNVERLAVVTHTGPRKLFVDDFEVSAENPAGFRARRAYEIDSFNHPQLDWFTLGCPEMKLDTSRDVIAGNALDAHYQQMEDAFVLVVHALPHADFSGASHLAFDIASDVDAHIIFVLEVSADVRFHVDVEVKGGGKAMHREVALSAFVPDEQNKSDAKLDLTKLKSIAFLDITGAYTGETTENTIHIGNVEMINKTVVAR